MKVGNVRTVAITEDRFPDHKKHYITIWVDTDWVSGEPTITEPDKWVDQQWRDFSSLPDNLFEPCWQNLRKVRPELFE
jgi:hypothetical protein